MVMGSFSSLAAFRTLSLDIMRSLEPTLKSLDISVSCCLDTRVCPALTHNFGMCIEDLISLCSALSPALCLSSKWYVGHGIE